MMIFIDNSLNASSNSKILSSRCRRNDAGDATDVHRTELIVGLSLCVFQLNSTLL